MRQFRHRVLAALALMLLVPGAALAGGVWASACAPAGTGACAPVSSCHCPPGMHEGGHCCCAGESGPLSSGSPAVVGNGGAPAAPAPCMCRLPAVPETVAVAPANGSVQERLTAAQSLPAILPAASSSPSAAGASRRDGKLLSLQPYYVFRSDAGRAPPA